MADSPITAAIDEVRRQLTPLELALETRDPSYPNVPEILAARDAWVKASSALHNLINPIIRNTSHAQHDRASKP